jgi:hypothetical protein
MPADATEITPGNSCAASTAAAKGLRQMFPLQTISTRNRTTTHLRHALSIEVWV